MVCVKKGSDLNMTGTKTVRLCRRCATDARKAGWRLAAPDGGPQRRAWICGSCGWWTRTNLYEAERRSDHAESQPGRTAEADG